MSRILNKGSAAAAGLIVLAVGLVLLRRETLSTRVVLDFRWLGVLILAKCISLLLKNSRWRQLLAGVSHQRAVRTLQALASAYLVNLLVPFRAGEMVRLSALKQANPTLPAEDVVATIAVEHLFDAVFLIGLFALGGVALATTSVGRSRPNALVPIFAVAVLGLGAAAIMLHRRRGTGLWTRAMAFVGRTLRQAGRLLTRPMALAGVALTTVIAWSFDAVALFAAAHAAGIHIDPLQAAWVVAGFNVGLAVSSTPAQLGAHQALAVLLLVPMGASVLQALAVSVGLQGVNVLVFGCFGYRGLTDSLRQVSAATRRLRRVLPPTRRAASQAPRMH